MFHNLLIHVSLVITALLITIVVGAWNQEKKEFKQWFERAGIGIAAVLWVIFELLAVSGGWFHRL